ncbi:hypothetical protein SAMN07250955_105217 [Arboricoccus pini]|uniref:Uncharacterized protein n=1 Tax=Arboricoccus pini TaxID=1963835 RepID=A0A212R4H6_9PROT|nr:hypothetical protein SAMN07250955_105217 [Arboricoccus pini]
MRTELKKLSATGANLHTWRRRLILEPTLHPCRRSVISDPYTRARARGGWTQQRGALMTTATRRANAAVLDGLVKGLKFQPDATYPSNEVAQQHLISPNVPMQAVVDALVEYRFEDPRDTASFTGLLVTIGEALRRDKNCVATVYQMRPTAVSRRDIHDDGAIDNFLQGRTDRVGGYPGDTSFKGPDCVTVQLHAYDLNFAGNGKLAATAAPLIGLADFLFSARHVGHRGRCFPHSACAGEGLAGASAKWAVIEMLRGQAWIPSDEGVGTTNFIAREITVHMAGCTAPRGGHRSARAAANCPACRGRSRYGYSSGYSSPSYSSPSYYFPSGSGGGGRSSGGGTGPVRASWSKPGPAVFYTLAEVGELTPVRANVEELVSKRPEFRDVFLCHAWDDRHKAVQTNRATSVGRTGSLSPRAVAR